MLKKIQNSLENRVLGVLLGGILTFAVIAKGAHDLWASTTATAGLIILAAGAIAVSQWRTPRFQWPVPLVFSWIFLLAALGLSAWMAANRFDARWEWFDWVAAAMAFFLSARAFSGKKGLDLLALFFGLWAWVMGAASLGLFISKGFNLTAEIEGTLINANALSGFILLLAPVLIHKSIQVRKTKGPGAWFWLGALAAAGLSLFLALSLTAWVLILAASPIIFRKIFEKSGLGLAVWLALTAAAAAGVIAFHALFFDAVREPLSRLIWWEAALRMWMAHPWIGVGLDNFSTVYLAFKTGPSLNTLFAHSWPLAFLSQAGILGTGAFLWLVASLFKESGKHQSDEKRPFLAGLALFLIFGLVNLSLEYLGPLLVFSTVMAAVAVNENSRTISFSQWTTLAAAGGAIILLPSIFTPFVGHRLVGAGYAALQRENANEAFVFFSDAAELDSLNWRAFEGMGMANRLRHKTTQSEMDLINAIAGLNRAHDLNPYHPGILRRLAFLYQKAGLTEKARETAAAADRLMPAGTKT